MKSYENTLVQAKIILKIMEQGGQVDLPNDALLEICNSQNRLDSHFHDLQARGALTFDGFGGEGFAEFAWVNLKTEQAAKVLGEMLEEINQERNQLVVDKVNLQEQISGMLDFDPFKLQSDIRKMEKEMLDINRKTQSNPALKGIEPEIKKIHEHTVSISLLASHYTEAYKALISPLRKEGESSIKATKRWAIIGIIASAVISVALSNYKDIYNIFKPPVKAESVKADSVNAEPANVDSSKSEKDTLEKR
ncbi:hypothetical protein [Azospirillum brasilense]|uniref:hypothetical protein n=1 Tax=Azospirillum brasilense TaxID=192 RepID=UPI0013B402A2|nr:hypothetical protein [Azospirillum brasilense]